MTMPLALGVRAANSTPRPSPTKSPTNNPNNNPKNRSNADQNDKTLSSAQSNGGEKYITARPLKNGSKNTEKELLTSAKAAEKEDKNRHSSIVWIASIERSCGCRFKKSKAVLLNCGLVLAVAGYTFVGATMFRLLETTARTEEIHRQVQTKIIRSYSESFFI